MEQYKLIVAYDGTDYEGWQTQPHGKTVVDRLEKSFHKAFKVPATLLGASRTDAGVHALGQVAWLRTPLRLPLSPKRIEAIWSRLLPPAIAVRNIKKIGPSFHPLKNVLAKTYYYHIFDTQPLPFCSRYGHWPKHRFDSNRLALAFAVFEGTHDFRSFCTGYEMAHTIATINAIRLSFIKRYKVWRVTVQGERFFRYMIRRIVGAALDVASSTRINLGLLKEALERPNPEQPFTTAPARGLLLHSIKYAHK